MRLTYLLQLSLAASLLLAMNAHAKPQVFRGTSSPKLFLRTGWAIQSSAVAQEKGEVVSKNGFAPTTKWYQATVPSTVVGVLVENKTYPDPSFGTNLRSMPGCSYPIGANFSLLPMPDDSPFRSSWWYRTEFRLPVS